MKVVERSNDVYVEMYEILDALALKYHAIPYQDAKKLKEVLCNDMHPGTIRWDIELSSMMPIMHPDGSNTSKIFELVVEFMNHLKVVAVDGYIDQTYFMSTIEAMVSVIRYNSLPLSDDVDLYFEYFQDNSPLAEDPSSY